MSWARSSADGQPRLSPLATVFNHCRGCGTSPNPPTPRTTGAILNLTAPRLEIELQHAADFLGSLLHRSQTIHF